MPHKLSRHSLLPGWCRRGLFLVSIVAVAFGPADLCARSFSKFRRIGADQGLNAGPIVCMIQDHEGFVWMCTRYTLLIRCVDDRGHWQPKEPRHAVIVDTASWEPWCAALAVLALTASITAGFVLQRKRRRRLFEHALAAARERERYELAGDLPDGPLQELYATRFILEDREELARDNIESLDTMPRKVRSDLHSVWGRLQAPHFESAFEFELEHLLESFQERSAEISYSGECELGELEIPRSVQLNLYRLIRTLLTNVQKHSEATRAFVLVRCKDSALVVDVRDNGKGFDPKETVRARGNGREHSGLLLMRSYAEAIGASLDIISAHGRGTTVRATWRPPGMRSSLLKRLTNKLHV